MEYITEREEIYSLDENQKKIALIRFPETEPGVFCIEHTIVDPSLAGRGIAGELVKMAVEQIGRNGGKVTATCSYAVRWLEKHQQG